MLFLIMGGILYLLNYLFWQGKDSPSSINATIQFWRFIFTIFICLLHFDEGFAGKYYFSSGAYLAVDFFFILSGFLLAQHFEKAKEPIVHAGTAAISYIRKRMIALYPHYIFSLLILFLINNCIIFQTSPATFFSNLYHIKWEVILMQYSGLAGISVCNIPTWYLSALCITSYFLYFLLSDKKDTFVYFICPLSALLIYTYISRTNGNLAYVEQYNGIFLAALLRAWAGLSTGVISYYIYVYLKGYKYDNSRKSLLPSIVYFINVIFILKIIMFNGHSQEDFIIILLFSILIIQSFLNKDFFSSLLNRNLFIFLGKISYPIYLNHFMFRNLIPWCLGNAGNPYNYWTIMPLFLTITISFSYVTYCIIAEVQKNANKKYQKI